MTHYKEFFGWKKWDYKNPSVNQICEFISYESLFIQPTSLIHYISGIKYRLSEDLLREDNFDHAKVKHLLRGIAMRYGLPERDTREPMSVELLVRIQKIIDFSDHDNRCYYAAAIIGFLCCLRIGEFTIKNKYSKFIKKSQWHQNADEGKITLERTKTDIFGRGTEIIYVKMKSKINPIYWMAKYSNENKIWKSPDDPLFVLKSGLPLDRYKLISWLKKNAKTVGFKNYDNLNGISFRRGCVQTLKEQGFPFEEFGKVCRWKNEACAKRYVKTNAKIIKKFAEAFDKVAEANKAWGE